MPPLSSRLNIRNLENSDPQIADTSKTSSNGSSDSEVKNSLYPIHKRKELCGRELSNDASNETSDSDKALPHSGAPSAVLDEPAPADVDARGYEEDEENADEENSTNNLVNKDSKPTKKEKKFFCKICNQGFTRKHNMVSHELIHLSSKPHVCTVCDLSFRRIHDLKRHEKLHLGEKPFHCEKCNRRFARTDALTRHLNSPNACPGRPSLSRASLKSNAHSGQAKTESSDSAVKPSIK